MQTILTGEALGWGWGFFKFIEPSYLSERTLQRPDGTFGALRTTVLSGGQTVPTENEKCYENSVFSRSG